MPNKYVRTLDMANYLSNKFGYDNKFSRSSVINDIATQIYNKYNANNHSVISTADKLYKKYGSQNLDVNKIANTIANKIFSKTHSNESNQTLADKLYQKYGSAGVSKPGITKKITNQLYQKEYTPLNKRTLTKAVRYIKNNKVKEADYGKVINLFKSNQNVITKADISKAVSDALENISNGLTRAEVDHIVSTIRPESIKKVNLVKTIKQNIKPVPKALTRTDAHKLSSSLTHDTISKHTVAKIVSNVLKKQHVTGDKLSANDFNQILHALYKRIDANLYDGKSVPLNGVGVLRRAIQAPQKAHDVPNYLGRHKTAHIPAKPAYYTVRFKPSTIIKNQLRKKNVKK